MEHVTGCQLRLSLIVILPISPQQVTIAPDDFLFFGVPDDELLVAVLAGIEFVNVNFLACTTTRFAKYNLS